MACRPQLLPLNFVSREQLTEVGVQAGQGEAWISTFLSGVAWASPSPLPTKTTLIWFLSREGHQVVFMSAHEGSPPKPVSPCSSGPGSAKILGWPDSKPGRGRLRVPQVGKLPVGGEPFTIVCNLFSKIYFVTIYLSFKKGKLLPKPHPPKNNFFFHNSYWCGCF